MALASPRNPLSPPPFSATLKPAPFTPPHQPLVPSFSVKLNGQALVNDIAPWIVSAAVEDSLDTPSMFELQLISKQDQRGTTSWTNDPRLALGAEVELSIGYGSDLTKLRRLIVGDIMALEPSFTIGGPPTLIVRGYDRRNRLNGVRRHRTFATLTDAEIAQRVCELAKVTVLATDNGVQHKQMVQSEETDWDFLHRRATAIGYELVMDASAGNDGRTILFRPSGNGAPAIATLTLNDDLFEFHPRLSLQPVSQVHALGWDPKIKQPISVSAGSDSVPPMEGNPLGVLKALQEIFGPAIEPIVHVVESVAEANTIASGSFTKAALSFVSGAGSARGRPDIRAGTVITIDVGDVFSGNYYVEAASHRYAPRSGYLTEFYVKRTAS